MCEALKELMAEEFQEEREQEREQVTEQLIRNAYESVGDLERVSEILKIPMETVKKAIEKEK